MLSLLAAKHAGHPQADAALAQVYAKLGQHDKCRHHLLLALQRAPADPALLALAQPCKADPAAAAREPDPRLHPSELAQKLYAEAYSLIYGGTLSPSQRREFAKHLYAEAAALGLARAHTGLAAIYLYGESDRARCREHAQAAVDAGEKGQAVKLLAQCKL